LAQLSGAVVGTVIANLMFGLGPVAISETSRFGPGLWLGEIVATFGLVLVIFGLARSGAASVAPLAIGAFIAAAFWFTSSGSFANPAVTVARVFSNTFSGIAPGSVIPFLVAELIGGCTAAMAVRLLYPAAAAAAQDIVVPHGSEAGREP
jgi:arsenate reductase